MLFSWFGVFGVFLFLVWLVIGGRGGLLYVVDEWWDMLFWIFVMFVFLYFLDERYGELELVLLLEFLDVLIYFVKNRNGDEIN